MNPNRWLAAVFVILSLGGCTPAATQPGQAPYAPYSHDSGADLRGGTDGGGGGM